MTQSTMTDVDTGIGMYAGSSLTLSRTAINGVHAGLYLAGTVTLENVLIAQSFYGIVVTEPSVTSVLGVDVSLRALDRAEARLRLDEMSERRRERITLAQSALTYTDKRLRDRDIATVVEVIEHLDAERLDGFARVVFGDATPQTVVVTTPNREYNVHFEHLPRGRFRHGDHRFEWTRAEFGEWAAAICSEYGYNATFAPVGNDDPETGPPTQMAVFRKAVS